MVEDLDTDLITLMVVTILVPHSGVADNLVVITEIITMHTLMNRMLHGALAVVVLSLVIEVPEVVRVLLLYTSITAINQ